MGHYQVKEKDCSRREVVGKGSKLAGKELCVALNSMIRIWT